MRSILAEAGAGAGTEAGAGAGTERGGRTQRNGGEGEKGRTRSTAGARVECQPREGVWLSAR